jgi:hypothetical protein
VIVKVHDHDITVVADLLRHGFADEIQLVAGEQCQDFLGQAADVGFLVVAQNSHSQAFL